LERGTGDPLLWEGRNKRNPKVVTRPVHINHRHLLNVTYEGDVEGDEWPLEKSNLGPFGFFCFFPGTE